MAITANVNDTNSAAVEEKQIVTLEFEAKREDFREAAVLLIQAIGSVRSLSSSLIGKKPICAEGMGINQKEHERIRKFSDAEQLQEFKAYMAGLMQRCRGNAEGKKPVFANAGEKGFTYMVDSGRANVIFQDDPSSNGWVVRGMACLCDPRVVERKLLARGFVVRVNGEEIVKAAS